MIGDVDLAMQLRPRFQNADRQQNAEQSAMNRAPRLRNVVEQVFWPRTEVARALRGRSKGLELHDIQLLEQVLRRASKTSFRVVFGAWSPTVRA
jgi:hypothetical protein